MALLADFIKLNSLSVGKDKLCRLVQYGSKMCWFYLEQKDKNGELITKLKSLESSLSSTRKLIRIGKSLENFQAAFKLIHLNDSVWRATATASRITVGLYLLMDHVLWFSQVGLIAVDKRKIGHYSANFWLTSVILNLTRVIYDLNWILRKEYNSRKTRNHQRSEEPGLIALRRSLLFYSQLLFTCIAKYAPIFLELLRNTCDLPVSLSGSGKPVVSPGLVGLFGVISSVIGIVTIYKPALKLVPA